MFQEVESGTERGVRIDDVNKANKAITDFDVVVANALRG